MPRSTFVALMLALVLATVPRAALVAPPPPPRVAPAAGLDGNGKPLRG